MALRRPKALLIDFDGVIRRWPRHDASIEQRFGLEPGALHTTAFALDLLMPAITGVVSDEAWRGKIAARLARAHGADVAQAAVAAWSEPAGDLDEASLALLDRCRPDLRVVLVSNATSRLPQDLARLGIAERFFAVVNSSDVGMAKPATVMFEQALRCAGVQPAEALFVDDSAMNVDAATRLGIVSHCFTSHAALEAFLRQQGAFAAEQG